jgi:hypothetical protein
MQGLETVGQEELEMLHSEAVMAGTAGDDNVWFKSIDARLASSPLISEVLTCFQQKKKRAKAKTQCFNDSMSLQYNKIFVIFYGIILYVLMDVKLIFCYQSISFRC